MSGSDSKWFASYNVNDLLPKDFKLISVQTTTPLADALKLLRENNIASLPVYDPASKTYIGFIGIIDIVTVVVLMARVREIVSSFIRNPIPLDEYLNHENGIFAETTVKDVANLSERNPWCPVFEGKPLHSLLDMFSKETNLHRIPVVNNDGEVVGLVSQSRLLEWLNEHLPKFSHVGEKKITTSSGPLVFTRASESALDAYTEMLEKKVTGLPVLDSDEKLLACISTSDLKGSSGINLFKDLYLPVKDYLNSRSEQFPREKSLSPVTITPDATVKEALNKFVTNKVHRLFVIGSDGKPSSVCSLCDLITSIREW